MMNGIQVAQDIEITVYNSQALCSINISPLFFFFGGQLLVPRAIPMLEDYSLSVVLVFLFIIRQLSSILNTLNAELNPSVMRWYY
jgi:hypothetical protein